MIMLPWSRLSAVIAGDDLHVVLVSGGPLGATVRGAPVFRRFLAMPVDEARAALAPFASARRVILTTPAAWCALRPAHVTVAQWPGAREEIARSIDRLLPLSPDDAMIGVIDEGDGAAPAERGCLVAARRSQVQPWADALARALGRPISEVISAHMAMPGLGLQGDSAAEVVERSGGAALRHTLAFGRPVAFAEPVHDGSSKARLALPSQEGAAVEGEIAPRDLAIGAALSAVVAPGVYAPLHGRAARARPAWLAPAAAIGVAAALLLSAGPVFDGRLERGLESLRAEQDELVDRVQRVEGLRRRAERSTALLREGVAAPTASWRSVLPLVVETQNALGERGFFYRVDVGQEHLAFSGEVGAATATLERLEASAMVERPRFRTPVRPSATPGLDVVDIRADRRKGGAR